MTTNTPTDEIAFSTIPSLTTCSQVTIRWTYRGSTFPTSDYALVVVGGGTVQGNHNHREYPLVPRQGTTTVNMTLATVNPLLGRFDWPKVNIPQGQYHVDVYASAKVISSNSFAVTNGVDVSCLVAPSQPPIPPPSTPSVAPSSTLSVAPSSAPSFTRSPSPTMPSASNPSATSSTPFVGSSSVNKGAVAGVVVTGVVILVLLAAVALWVFRRRRTRARNATPPGSALRTKGQASKGLHNPSESTGAILALDSGNRENSPQPSTLEDFASEKSTIAHDDPRPNLTPIATTRSFWRSSASSRRPVSMTVKPSFESSETVQSRSSRQLHRSLDSTMAPSNMTVILPSPPPPSHPRRLSDRTRRTSRKPVPVYDPGEFPASGSDDIPLSRWSGGGTETYYLIPDAPLEQRK